LGDGFGIPVSAAFRDFESFFNKFLGPQTKRRWNGPTRSSEKKLDMARERRHTPEQIAELLRQIEVRLASAIVR